MRQRFRLGCEKQRMLDCDTYTTTMLTKQQAAFSGVAIASSYLMLTWINNDIGASLQESTKSYPRTLGAAKHLFLINSKSRQTPTISPMYGEVFSERSLSILAWQKLRIQNFLQSIWILQGKIIYWQSSFIASVFAIIRIAWFLPAIARLSCVSSDKFCLYVGRIKRLK